MPASHPFTHLQVHSDFTLLGGTASVEELAARAAADGMTHLALTDTNALYGAVAFARACRDHDVEPIVGMTVTVALPDGTAAAEPALPGRLVLLATGPSGYRSLCRLSSLIQGSPEREQRAGHGLKWEELQAHREGLICLSGGRMGWIARFLAAGDQAAAHLYAGRLAGAFGDDVYLSVEIHTPADVAIARQTATLGRRLGIPVVAVQPVYCLSPEDAPCLRLLAAIDRNCRLEEVPAASLPAFGDSEASLHWLSPAEVAARFAGLPETMATAGEIASRCGPSLPSGKPVWPVLDLPQGQTPDEALAELADRGLVDRFGAEPPQPVRERLAGELAAIARHGYAPLFLVVTDIVCYARQQDVPVSTRGSVANSLVAYCAGITTIDPIAHDLLFERFLNPARARVPDIDLDFCSRRRDEVLDYVRRTCGPERVALIGTVSTMQPRSAVWETGKAYGLDEKEIKRLVALLPRGWHPDPRRRDRRTVDDVLQSVEEPRLREVVRAAYTVVGRPHHLSVHPGGIVISPGPLTDLAPVQWAPKGFLITQFDHDDVEVLGLPKIDLLGISALTVQADAAEFVRRDLDPAFRLDGIPPNDPATGELLARGETVGVFQCESDGAQRTLRKLRARTVRDLAVANAFFKPGPSTGGMAANFVRRYRGEEPVTYQHPSLEPILGSTQGVLLFQEQILRIAREIAGLGWDQADSLRRGASHFGAAEMAAVHEQFVEGCCRPGPDGPAFAPPEAEKLWEQVLAFSGYGFNKGHATAYAEVSYRSAYLKTHYPAAFMCARLIEGGGFHHPAVYIAEAVRLGIAVRPPHVNHSAEQFTLAWEDGGAGEGERGRGGAGRAVLWMGLGQVRDLRQSAIQAILAERQREPFADVRDLLQRVPLQAKEMQHMVACGALDGLGASRAALLATVEEVRGAGSALQLAFGFEQEVPAEPPAQRLAWEQEILGQPVSVHPLDLVADRLPSYIPVSRLATTGGRPVRTAGVRLPGWTGGDGFFLGDGRTYTIVREPESAKTPAVWQPLLVRGRWAGDGWGSSWLQADEIQPIA